MTLVIAVVAPFFVFSQVPLSHEDSLVLAEAAPYYSAADSLRLTDSLSRADSALRSRVRVLSFAGAIDAVLKDLPYNLRNITGELVLAQGEFENYASIVELPGAEHCVVTRWHSADDTTASWQAKMFSGEDFGQAAKAYRELFRKLQGCHLTLIDGSVIYLKGDWEPAKESASFTTSTLRLMTGDWRYRDVKVELELVYQLADWAVHINIVTKKRDDEVGGHGLAENQ